MEQKRHIVILGNSVILGTLNISLKKQPQFDVFKLDSLMVQPGDIESLKPDVIFFDLNMPVPQSAFSLLESRPDMILIGISPDKNEARIWSGEQLSELSTRDLLEVIKTSPGGKTASLTARQAKDI